jgi:hypothetical protein
VRSMYASESRDLQWLAGWSPGLDRRHRHKERARTGEKWQEMTRHGKKWQDMASHGKTLQDDKYPLYFGRSIYESEDVPVHFLRQHESSRRSSFATRPTVTACEASLTRRQGKSCSSTAAEG